MSDSATGMSPERRALWTRRATYAAVATALFLVAIKAVAWFMSGSVAMLSSLTDSALDCLASILNLLAVRHAQTPADNEHRFGHGKAEALAGLGQAAFIGLSGLFLVGESLRRLAHPEPVTAELTGILVSLIAIAATLALVLFQGWVLRRTHSVAIDADSLHYRSDLLLNAGVILALAVNHWVGWPWFDPAVGLAIAAVILSAAFSILRSSYDMVMDRELPFDDRKAIYDLAKAQAGVQGVHDLRTRAAGPQLFVQLHVVLDGRMPLMCAHATGDLVEAAVRARFPHAEVLVHLDPANLEEPHGPGPGLV